MVRKIKPYLNLKIIALGAITLVLLGCCLAALNQISATLHYHEAKNRLTTWHRQGTIDSVADYEAAKSAAREALAASHNNPLYLDVLADIYQWGLYKELEKDRTAASQTAMQLYQLSLTQRPAWPVTWANMALLKWRSGEFDEAFHHYLARADALGKSQPEVHLLFAELGLVLYSARNPLYTELKDKVKHRLYQAVVNPLSREKALNIIARHQAKRTACRWLAQSTSDYASQLVNCSARSTDQEKSPQTG